MTLTTLFDTTCAAVEDLHAFLNEEFTALYHTRKGRAIYRLTNGHTSITTHRNNEGAIGTTIATHDHVTMREDVPSGLSHHQILADRQKVPHIITTIAAHHQAIATALTNLTQALVEHTPRLPRVPQIKLVNVGEEGCSIGINLEGPYGHPDRWALFNLHEHRSIILGVFAHLHAICSYKGASTWVVSVRSELCNDQRVQAPTATTARIIAALQTNHRLLTDPACDITIAQVHTSTYTDFIAKLCATTGVS